MFTVKTKERAIEILQEWLDQGQGDFTMEPVISGCQCGQTMAIEATKIDSNEIATVTFCGGCGDDDAFVDDVLDIR